jgi:hypothetical protein
MGVAAELSVGAEQESAIYGTHCAAVLNTHGLVIGAGKCTFELVREPHGLASFPHGTHGGRVEEK